jgi:hypothetical protein
MYIVSDEYKEQIRQPLRNPSSVKVLLDIENTDANDSASFTASTPVSPISNVAVLNGDYYVTDRIGTMELNRFILDGESSFGLDPDPEIYQGYLSQLASDVSNVWTSSPYVIMDFGSAPVYLDGLSFVFDNLLHGYPTDLRLEAFNGVTSVLDTNVYPDSYEWTYNTPLPPCTQIIITAEASSLRYWRFRLEDVIFGIVKEFDGSVITTCNWKQDVDLINAKLPTYDFDFSFIDINNEFNPDDELSLYKYLSDKQRVRFYFGYELNDASVEWIKGSEYYTTGDATIDSNGGINTLSIKSSSRLFFLTEDYTAGKFMNNPWALHSLLGEIEAFIGIDPLYADILHPYSYIIYDYDALDIQTTIPIPLQPVNQCLQLIANAGMCVMQIDRDGKIVIIPRSTDTYDFALTFSDMMKPPLITKFPKLQGVDTTITMVSNETNYSTIVEKDVVNANYNWYEFKYDNYTAVQVSVSGTISIIESEIYDTLTRIVVNGTGTITITGKKKILTEQLYPIEYQSVGERCPISNTLVSTEEHAIAFANWVAEYASCTNQYEIENRGFPELDMDNINFDTLLSKNLFGTVFYNEISYDGAISGKTKVLMAKNFFATVVNKVGTFNCGEELILPMGYSK